MEDDVLGSEQPLDDTLVVEDIVAYDDTRACGGRNGFAGLDGIFRFKSNGIAERGLAVLEMRRGRFQIISPAPEFF